MQVEVIKKPPFRTCKNHREFNIFNFQTFYYWRGSTSFQGQRNGRSLQGTRKKNEQDLIQQNGFILHTKNFRYYKKIKSIADLGIVECTDEQPGLQESPEIIYSPPYRQIWSVRKMNLLYLLEVKGYRHLKGNGEIHL